MIRKIFLFIMLICAVLPARAQSDKYCFSSTKISEMWTQLSQQNQSPDMQRAYETLFNIMLTNNESDSVSDSGCITTTNFAQICKNVWGNDTEKCKTFMQTVITTPEQKNYTTLEYSCQLKKTNFDDIDPDTFNQAVNKAVARRRDKNVPSKLQDMGKVFLAQAQEKQINPFMSASISLYESGRGTSRLARTKNNIAGLGGPGRWMSFATVPDSIAKQAQVLQRNVNNGKTDLNTLACSGAYCATNTNPWFRDVTSVAKQLYKYYNEIIQSKK